MVNRRRRVRRPRAPMPVVAVPVELAPSFCVPIAFSLTSSGTVPLNAGYSSRPWRVCSIRATLASPTVGNCIISLWGGRDETGHSEVTQRCRPLVVAAGMLEVKMRNSAKVQHVLTTGTPTIVSIDITGTLSLTGIVYVSFRGAM